MRHIRSPNRRHRRQYLWERTKMDLQQRTDFVDLVAQAVVDKIEERDRINGMVNMVV